MLIILHGALGSASQMEPLQVLMQKYGKKCLLLDLPGHGLNAHLPGFGMDTFWRYVSHSMDGLKIEKADFFGYSMGGYVALALALNEAQKVGKIMTFSTKFNWTPQGAEHEVKMLDPEKIQEKVPAFAMQLSNRHGKNWKLLLQKTAHMMLDLGNKPLLTGSELKQIQHPVLLSTGDADKTATPEETLAAFRQMPNARLWISPATPHPFEKLPQTEIAAKLNDFISE
jgi:pimeloyl-ACP methyl ester carboxylesterase